MTNETTAKRRVIMMEEGEPMTSAHGAPRSIMTTHMSDMLTSAKIERINDRELTSIYALLAYVSYNQNVQQETVQMIVEAQFGVDNVAKIKRDDYMRAIEFLVDLKMDEVIN